MRNILCLISFSACLWGYGQPAFHAWDAYEINNFLTEKYAPIFDGQFYGYTGRYLYDTIIQGQNYQAFVYGQYTLPGGAGTFEPYATQYFTRDGDKVYTIYPTNVDTAYRKLAFDYDSSPGDTVPLFEELFAFYIETVDTQYIYGRNRRVYSGYLAQYVPGVLAYMVDFGSGNCDTCAFTMVEGMGSNYPIFLFTDNVWNFSFGPFSTGNYQHCKLKAYDSLFTLVYDYAECDILTRVDPNSISISFTMNGRQIPLTHTPCELRYSIYSLDGRQVQEETLNIPYAGYAVTVPVPAGLSVLQVVEKGNEQTYVVKLFTPE